MRFLSTVLFAAAAGWVYYYNGSHTDSALVLPMMDVMDPSTAGNPQAQGRLSVQVLLGLAVAFALWDTAMWLKARNTKGDEP